MECRGIGAIHQSRHSLYSYCHIKYHIQSGIDNTADLFSHIFIVSLLIEIPDYRDNAGVLHISLFNQLSLHHFIHH
jgi:hypothetical protein